MNALEDTTNKIASFIRNESKVLSKEHFNSLDFVYKNLKMYLDNGGIADEKQCLSTLIDLMAPVRAMLWGSETTKKQAINFEEHIFQPVDSKLLEILRAERNDRQHAGLTL